MNLGMPEMIFIFLLALVIFGPKKLPELGREVGKALAEFKRASNDFKNQLENEIDQLDIEKQRDYYRSRAEELAREAQEAFSINPPENRGTPRSESAEQVEPARSFDAYSSAADQPLDAYSKPTAQPDSPAPQAAAPESSSSESVGSVKGTNA